MKKEEQIEALKQAVEDQFGQSVSSPADFARLGDELRAVLDDSLSVSTLKRVWGYVAGYASVRTSTLNTLSRYVGCRDWQEFCDTLSKPRSSSFPDGDMVAMSALAIGDLVELTWAPGRRIVARYMGQGRMCVVENMRSKLMVGTTFTCAGMVNGERLMVTQVELPGTLESLTYVCGKHGGITARVLTEDGRAQDER
ncbi:MAG: hypothetical protein IKR25_11350 [Muribaculaceae bacterium]|nr:hypothetical protein [Muribaculaceae bacterium]